MKADIAVIGSGLAALVAARTIQQAGRHPVLVWPGLSSLYFVFATIDVVGYRDPFSRETVSSPAKVVAELIAGDQTHPYARAGLDALRAGILLLIDWLPQAGLSWHGVLDRNYLLPTAIGAVKPACLVPASMTAGDLDIPQPMVLCGFEGYGDFIPELAASNLAAGWGRDPRTVTALRVPVPGFSPGRLFSSVDLARSFEEPAFREQVAERIRAAVSIEDARVGIPAVLGMTRHLEAHRHFEQLVGRPVFEIPTLPPSILGLRLFDGLRKHLQESGVEIIWGASAHASEVSGDVCARLLLKSAGRDRPLEASAYVLALEDTVDGAMRAGIHTIREPFFGQTLAETAEPAARSHESLFHPQPFAQVGYPVNNRLQPIDGAGKPLARNVFVAGGAIAGYDPVGTRSRGGLAVATGYRAAHEAMAA